MTWTDILFAVVLGGFLIGLASYVILLLVGAWSTARGKGPKVTGTPDVKPWRWRL